MRPNISEHVLDFRKRIISFLPFPPTEGQDHAIHALSRFTFSLMPRCALLLKGYAGTGKTSITAAYVNALKATNVGVVLLAPTGRAAKVLSGYSKTPAFTIHKKIYFPKRGAFGASGMALGQNKHKNTVFIVDEASMIGGQGIASEESFQYRSLLDDLIQYVYQGERCRLVLIGDEAQLPPVGSSESPALQSEVLQNKYNLTIAEMKLTEVVRQERDSGILHNATILRNQIVNTTSGFPQLKLESFKDIHSIGGNDLQEILEDLYQKHGRNGVMVITRSNKRANLFNQSIRTRIEWFEERLNAGDLIMIVKNNYHWLKTFKDAPTNFIANGDTAEILKIVREQELYGFNFADVEIRLIDYPEMQPFEVKIMLESIDVESANIPRARISALYDEIALDYADLGDQKKIKQAVSEDPFFNALQVKFAYSVTCHKSQGGQWPAVVLDQGYLTEEMLDTSLLRWFYTAFTRAQTELYLLNFHKEFFIDSNSVDQNH
ncbi:MAG: AAA family ATPase [Flavobacteriales bacterium]|nr:AAA family ATPase [Flavobacteriales bacterium]